MATEELSEKSLAQLKKLQSKIELEIEAKKQTKEAKKKLYESIKDDFGQHRRPDGRKTFRGVGDYLECYVRGLPPITRSKFFARFGITGRRAKVTPAMAMGRRSLVLARAPPNPSTPSRRPRKAA